MKVFRYNELERADLVVDAIYEGGGSIGELGDPISKLLKGVGNLGGFRPSGRKNDRKFVVLYTSGENRDWPISFIIIDLHNMIFGSKRDEIPHFCPEK